MKVVDVKHTNRVFTLEIDEIDLKLIAVACGITSTNERENGYKRVFGVEMPSDIRDVNYAASPYADIMNVLENKKISKKEDVR